MMDTRHLMLFGRLTGKIAQITDDRRHLIDVGDNLAKSGLRLVVSGRVFERGKRDRLKLLSVSANRLKWLIELMSNARGELPKRGQLSRLHEGLLHRMKLGVLFL